MDLWIASRSGLGGHKKLFLLCQELKLNLPTAVGHLHYLWWWVLNNRSQDGDLIGLFPVDIARAAKYEGNPKRFLDALIRCEWIDEDMKIHDWGSHAGPLLKARERKARWKRTIQERSKNVPRTSKEHITEQNRTEQNSKELKTREKAGFLSKKDEKILQNDIAKAKKVSPSSEFVEVRIGEIVEEIAKAKDVRDPIALARHKAIHQ